MIESTKNERVKLARALAQRKGRLEQGLHFIEGEKLVKEAVISNAHIVEVFIEEGHEDAAAALKNAGAAVNTVKRAVMESLSRTETPQWVAATVETPLGIVPETFPSGLIVALDGVQDPGNMGTIIRTADAMGAAGIMLGEGCADPYAPKPIRASMGSIYHLPVWQCDLKVQAKRMKEQGFALICGHLKGGDVMPEFGEKCVLVIGNEGNGVCDDVADLCEKYRLPMYGAAESLNASVAAGILMYEIAKKLHK